MTLKLNAKYLESFVGSDEMAGIKPQVDKAVELLHSKTGLGNDFLGWLSLPTDYDKEEFGCSHRNRYRRFIPWCKSCNGTYQVTILQQSQEGYT